MSRTELTATGVRGRLVRPRIIALTGACMLTALLSPVRPLGAQSAQARAADCEPREPWLMSSGRYAAPIAVREYGEDILVLGSPAYRFAPPVDGTPVIADSTMAGFIFSEKRGPVTVSRPVPGQQFTEPRIIIRGDRDADVLWVVPLPDSMDDEGRSMNALELWVGRLRRGEWSAISRLSRVSTITAANRQMSSDLVRVGDAYVMGMISSGEGLSEQMLLAWNRDGNWEVERAPLGLETAAGVQLAAHGGHLYAVVLGLPTEGPLQSSSEMTTATLWLFRRISGVWSSPLQVGGDGVTFVGEAKLVPSGDDLVLVWVDDAAPSLVRWRRVRGAASLGPIHEIPGVFDITQGEFPFRHLIGLAVSESEGRVVRPTADGYKTVASVPTTVGFIPVVAGSEKRPLAITLQVSTDAKRGPFELVGHDLSCALRPDGMSAGLMP